MSFVSIAFRYNCSHVIAPAFCVPLSLTFSSAAPYFFFAQCFGRHGARVIKTIAQLQLESGNPKRSRADNARLLFYLLVSSKCHNNCLMTRESH